MSNTNVENEAPEEAAPMEEVAPEEVAAPEEVTEAVEAAPEEAAPEKAAPEKAAPEEAAEMEDGDEVVAAEEGAGGDEAGGDEPGDDEPEEEDDDKEPKDEAVPTENLETQETQLPTESPEEAPEGEGPEKQDEEAAPDSQPTARLSGFDMMDASDEAETTSSEESSESYPTPLDRDPYYIIFDATMRDYGPIKRLNNFLHKKMSEYFKKRKMDHVLREAEHSEEASRKYGTRLDNFSDLIELDNKQRSLINAELDDMKRIKNEQYAIAARTFRSLVAREKEVGMGLISEKTGKEIGEKLVEKLIANQKSKAKELQGIRLTHIKMQNAVVEKHQAIRDMDKISDKYTLMEFEQLKIENQGHADKIEERDEELTRLRKKCSGAIQCLAHIREKCSAIEVNIKMTKEKLESKELERTRVREEMNGLKQQRDYYRLETQRMKDQHGLLTKDKLLIDMEDAMKETEELKHIIRTTQEKLANTQTKLSALKYNYEKAKRKKQYEKKMEKVMNRLQADQEAGKYRLHRPTLLPPSFEETRKFQ